MSGHAESHAHHTNYVKIWGILVVLLVISVLGPLTGIRAVMLITAFGIALVKAYLVAKNFMHLNVERPVVHYALGGMLLLMVLLYAGLAADVQKDRGAQWTKSTGFHYLGTPAPMHSESAEKK
jgi:caa(3)-type oxidase subunit IV